MYDQCCLAHVDLPLNFDVDEALVEVYVHPSLFLLLLVLLVLLAAQVTFVILMHIIFNTVLMLRPELKDHHVLAHALAKLSLVCQPLTRDLLDRLEVVHLLDILNHSNRVIRDLVTVVIYAIATCLYEL